MEDTITVKYTMHCICLADWFLILCSRHLNWNKCPGERSIDPIFLKREQRLTDESGWVTQGSVCVCLESGWVFSAAESEQSSSVCFRFCAVTVSWTRRNTGWGMKRLCADWDCWMMTRRVAAPRWVAYCRWWNARATKCDHVSSGVESLSCGKCVCDVKWLQGNRLKSKEI